MSVARTDDELNAAIEAMFRIRAVESPPDVAGLKTVWHRGARGAELVSHVDSAGRVTHQELTLFDDVIIWDRVKGLQAGRVMVGSGAAVSPAGGSTEVAVDGADERYERARRALNRYQGADRFIIHLRRVLDAEERGLPFDEHEVTNPGEAPVAQVAIAEPRRVLWPVVMIFAAVLIVVGVLLIYWLE